MRFLATLLLALSISTPCLAGVAAERMLMVMGGSIPANEPFTSSADGWDGGGGWVWSTADGHGDGTSMTVGNANSAVLSKTLYSSHSCAMKVWAFGGLNQVQARINGGSWINLNSVGNAWVQSSAISIPAGSVLVEFQNTSTIYLARVDDITFQ